MIITVGSISGKVLFHRCVNVTITRSNVRVYVSLRSCSYLTEMITYGTTTLQTNLAYCAAMEHSLKQHQQI